MMLYVIKAAITLALLYSCFFVLLSKETFHRFNRFMLLGIMVVSLIVPLFHITTAHPTTLNEEVYLMQTYIEQDTTPIVVTPTLATGITWMQALTGIYWAGVGLLLLLTLVQALSLIRFMHNGVRHTDERGNTVILHNCDVPPFSIFRFVVMSVKDYETSRQYILTHEQEHIRLGHTYDLLLLQCVKTFQWFNPFIWFLSRDLKAVHEYEADQAVINQGIDAKSYQQLLVIKVVGNRLQPFTNNLNHGSLKKRILMMYQEPKTRWRMLKALCAIPVVALTLNAFATPAEVTSVEDMVATLETKEVPTLNKVKEAILTTQEAVETASPDNTPQDPLIVINGTPVNLPADFKTIDEENIAKLLNISPEDVEGITVLNGTPAQALYGDKGKNGVVEIKVNTQKMPADSLLTKIPGLAKNATGNYTLDGKPVQKILVEGQEVYSGDDSPVFEICEEPAEFPGGRQALMQFISRNIRYPKEAAEHNIQGNLLVQFIVEKDGTCSNFKVVICIMSDPEGVTVTAMARKTEVQQQQGTEASESPEEVQAWKKSLEEEAVRICRLMPKWEPARQRGKAVRMKQTIPFTFRLQ